MGLNKWSVAIFMTLVSGTVMALADINSDELQKEKKFDERIRTLKENVRILEEKARIQDEEAGTLVQKARILEEKARIQDEEAGTLVQKARLQDGGFTAKVIKHAPYSTEVISENIQKLADGNMISNKVTSLSFRDSSGNTREEIRNGKGEVINIMIRDTNGGHISLNVKKKTAVKMPQFSEFFVYVSKLKRNMTIHTSTLGAVGEIVGQTGGELKELRIVKNGKTGESSSGGMRNVKVMIQHDNVDEKTNKIVVEEGRFKDVKAVAIETRGGGGDMILNDDDATLHSITRVFGEAKWAAKAQTKSLGSKDFGGVKADGKLMSYEIPAGEIGNANAIVVADETWMSPELQITVYSKHSDPRSGERIYRLNNLKREEVPASMFTIPVDYKVKDLSKLVLQKKIESELKKEKTEKVN